MASTKGTGQDEPVSPELILVSPSEAAQRARDGLFETTPVDTAEAPPRAPRRNEGSTRRASASPYARARSHRKRTRARRRRRLVIGAIAVSVLGAAFGWLVSDHWGSSSTGVRSGARSPSGATESASAGFVPARTFVWGATKGADRYRFRMTLDGRLVLHADTKAPRLALPRSFRFRPGTYRWTVERIPTEGRLLADSSFVLTAANAARANH